MGGSVRMIDGHIDEVNVVRWIPVTEQLPEQGQEVIVCILHRFGDKTVCWKRFWGETHFGWQDVTHWMPLPEPPTGRERRGK